MSPPKTPCIASCNSEFVQLSSIKNLGLDKDPFIDGFILRQFGPYDENCNNTYIIKIDVIDRLESCE